MPGSPQLHRWADWMELRAAVEDECYKEDVIEAIDVSRDTLSHDLLDDREKQDDHDDLIEDDKMDESPDAIADDGPVDGLPRPEIIRDRAAARSMSIMEIIMGRAKSYGEAYPFVLSGKNGIELADRTPARSLYLFLLACSLFRYIESKADQTALAADFEEIAALSLKELLPQRAQVHIFGSSPRSTDRYTGPLVDKVDLLAKDLQAIIVSQNLKLRHGRNDRGDKGLDIVAWVPHADPAPGMAIYFGQCACTPDWVNKQLTSSADAWHNILHFPVDPSNHCFIPYDFRDHSGKWWRDDDLRNAVIIDRRRIMALLADPEGTGMIVDSNPLIGQITAGIANFFWTKDRAVLGGA